MEFEWEGPVRWIKLLRPGRSRSVGGNSGGQLSRPFRDFDAVPVGPGSELAGLFSEVPPGLM